MGTETARRQLEAAMEKAEDVDTRRHILTALGELDDGDGLGADESLGASGLGAE